MYATKTLLTIVLAIIAVTRGSAGETQVRKCSNDAMLPLRVQVDGCTEMPCDLWKGYDNHMIIQFVANRNSMRHLTTDIQLTTLGMKIPLELEEERGDVCKNLMYGAYCPLDKGEDVTYHLVLPIADHQPNVPTKVEISILDSKDNSVVSCFVVDARIKGH